MKDELAAVFIVSRVTLAGYGAVGRGDAVDGETVKSWLHRRRARSERCWIYTDDIGSDTAHPTLCKRCAGVVSDIEK